MTAPREELLPCPHCGPGASICDAYMLDLTNRWVVGCGACGSHSGSCATEAEAVALWNRRAALREPVGEPAGAGQLASAEIDALRAENAGLRAEVKSAEARIAQLEVEVEVLRGLSDTLRTRAERAEADLAQAESDRDAL